MALVFDFDGTITQEDTISELAKAAIGYQHTKTAHDLSSTWDQVVKAYMDDRAAIKAGYPIHENERCTVDEEMEFMKAMKTAELASLERVRASGIFQGMHPDTLYQLGVEARESNRIKIREGFDEIFNLAMKHQWAVSVISVNWSAAFIRGVLHDYRFSQVIANEVSDNGEIVRPATLAMPLTSVSDKLEALDASTPSSNACCYFGDSTTDLACLLRNTGIVICNRDQPSQLLSTLKRLDQDCPHVSANYDVNTRGLNQRLFWARDFREVISSGVLEKVTTS